MKKIVFSFLALAMIGFPLFASASIDNNLKYGSTGPQVIELQEFLIAGGFLNSQATGNFYSLTKNAVIAYQKSANLPATGFVGPLTRDSINTSLDSSISVDEQQATTTTQISPDTAALQTAIQVLQAQLAQIIAQQKTQASQPVSITIQNVPAPVAAPVVTAAPPDVQSLVFVIQPNNKKVSTLPVGYQACGFGNFDFGNGFVKTYECSYSVQYTVNKITNLDAISVTTASSTLDSAITKNYSAMGSPDGSSITTIYSVFFWTSGSYTVTFTAGNQTLTDNEMVAFPQN